jgi:hypothetical protein
MADTLTQNVTPCNSFMNIQHAGFEQLAKKFACQSRERDMPQNVPFF